LIGLFHHSETIRLFSVKMAVPVTGGLIVTPSKVPVIQMYSSYQQALTSKDIQLRVMEMDQLPKFEQSDFSNARINQ